MARPQLTFVPAFRPARMPAIVSDAAYVEACRMWLQGAGDQDIADKLVIPMPALRELRSTREWQRQCNALREETYKGEAAALSRLVNFALQRVAERLEHGDPYVDNVGRVCLKPVAAKDAAAIAALLLERREKIFNKVDGKEEGDPFDDLGKLFVVAEKLRDFKKYQQATEVVPEPPTQVIEGVVT